MAPETIRLVLDCSRAAMGQVAHPHERTRMNQLEPTSGPNLRYAIIGCGAAIAETHFEALRGLPVDIVGASDIDAERGPSRAARLGCRFFVDHRQLLTEL